MLVSFPTGNKTVLMPTKVSELDFSNAHLHFVQWKNIFRFPDLQETFNAVAAPPTIPRLPTS